MWLDCEPEKVVPSTDAELLQWLAELRDHPGFKWLLRNVWATGKKRLESISREPIRAESREAVNKTISEVCGMGEFAMLLDKKLDLCKKHEEENEDAGHV